MRNGAAPRGRPFRHAGTMAVAVPRAMKFDIAKKQAGAAASPLRGNQIGDDEWRR
jgi:hypothetical protein